LLRNVSPRTSVTTVVFSKRAAKKKTARKRRATRSWILASSAGRPPEGFLFVGTIA
jgi:hypothetical protein